MANSEYNNHDKYADNIKTINEFLIDLIGVLVPGVIFLFSVSVSIIIPVILIYFRAMSLKGSNLNIVDNAIHFATKSDLLASNIFQGWFWLVLFFTFLILSYAIGNIFYRLDIREVDELSFKQQKKKLYKEKIEGIIEIKTESRYFGKIKKDQMDNFLKEYFELLFYHFKGKRKYKRKEKVKWMNCLDAITRNEKPLEILNTIAFSFYEEKFREKTLDYILKYIKNQDVSIPEITEPSPEKIVKNVSSVLKSFVKYEKSENNNANTYQEYLAIGWFFLFYLRSEVGCNCKKDCQFPYVYYDTYLVKRNELDMVKLAKWCFDKDSRTKNAINSYKMKIRLRAKEAYNIIVKNEAHIRMASSSYRVAKIMCAKKSLSFIFFFLLILLIPFGKCYCIEYLYPDIVKFSLIILCMPFLIFVLNKFIQKSVIKFMHYQRMREIFFVLQVYQELKNSKK